LNLRIEPVFTFSKNKMVHCFSELSPSQYVLHPPERMKKCINNQTFQRKLAMAILVESPTHIGAVLKVTAKRVFVR
jgi:hypothetical protein